MKFSDFRTLNIDGIELVALSTENTSQWNIEDYDIKILASDGSEVKYDINELSNENVNPFVFQYRNGSPSMVEKPYSTNCFLSSDVVGNVDISNIVAVDDENGHILSIGQRSLYRCSKLSSVNFPNALCIENYAFQFCENMRSINAENVINIGDSAFYHNSRYISSFNFPKVRSIGKYAFAYVTKLSTLNLIEQDEPPILGWDAFQGLSKYTVWVKNETYKKYLNATRWKDESISSHISSYTQPTITFLCGETIVSEQILNYNMSADAPIVSRPYYDFKGWDNSYNDVKSDVTCNAVFSKRFLNVETTTLSMANHFVTGDEAEFKHVCDEINPNVSCTIDGMTTVLKNTEDYTLTYANNSVDWIGIGYNESREQIAIVSVLGTGYYEGTVSKDFLIRYTRNAASRVTVSFDPCGGDVPATTQDIEYSINDTYGLCSQFTELDNNASRAGHKFLGWFDIDATERVKASDVITKTSPYTLSANWEISTFNVSAFANPTNYGTVNGSRLFISADIDWNTEILLSAEPDAGFKFVNWSDGNSLSVRTAVVRNDIELSANFTCIPYSIIYELDGGTATSNPTSYTFEDEVTLLSDTTKEAYTFSGWYDVDAKKYINKIDKGSIGNKTLSAIWKLTKYTFELSGGIGGKPNLLQKDYYSSSSSQGWTLQKAKRTGYQISTWTISGYTGDAPTIENYGDDYVITRIPANTYGNISANTIWEPTIYSITYHLDGGTATSNPTSYNIESETITLLNDTTKTNYDFVKWVDTDGNQVTQIAKGSTGDIVLSAIWKRQTVKLTYDTGYETDDRLRFVAQEAGSTITLDIGSAATYKTSTNGTDWTDYTRGTLCTLTNIGDKIYFSARDKNENCDAGRFEMTGKIAAEGNIQYLLDSTGECLSVPEQCYQETFLDCTSLTKAPELPATILATECYSSMFSNCTSLTSAPVLPATTLADGCYISMFCNCTSLTSAPEIHATTLANHCYNSMFYNCTSLSSSPVLSAESLACWCYHNMFENCTSLTSAPELPATTLVYGCYNSMFYNCTSLTKAPILSATTLDDSCYSDMFYNCNHLSVTTDSTKQGAYQILSVDSMTEGGFGDDMFTGTAGDFTGTPEAGQAYYCYGN